MSADEFIEVGELLDDLSKYNLSYVKPKVARIQDLMKPMIDNAHAQVEREELGLSSSIQDLDLLKEVRRTQNLLNGIETRIKNARGEISVYDRTIQDLLHALEFLDASDEELLEYAKELGKLQKLRRAAKEFIEMGSPLLRAVEKNKDFKLMLNESVEDMVQTDIRIKNRRYTPREKTTLEEAFANAMGVMDE